MKLPQCQYPSEGACGKCAAPIKNTFNMLWTLMDGKVDEQNIDLDLFGDGMDIVKKPAPGGGTKKRVTVPIGDETTMCYWQKKAPPDSGFPHSVRDYPGMQLFVDPSHSSGLGKMCIVDKRDVDEKQVLSIIIDPANGVSDPAGKMKANYGDLKLSCIEGAGANYIKLETQAKYEKYFRPGVEGMLVLGGLDEAEQGSILMDGTDIVWYDSWAAQGKVASKNKNEDITGTWSFPDSFNILGSVDPSKKLRFEVDGLTAATTRTYQAPDIDGYMLVTSGAGTDYVPKHQDSGGKMTYSTIRDDGTDVTVGTAGLRSDNHGPFTIYGNHSLTSILIHGYDGNSTDIGQDTTVRGGNSENATPGNLHLVGGTSTNTPYSGGHVYITGGNAGVDYGGDVNIQAGTDTVSGTKHGNININDGAGTNKLQIDAFGCLNIKSNWWGSVPGNFCSFDSEGYPTNSGYSSSSFQPADADLTSWAAVTRAAGFDTFAASPTSANLAALVTDDGFQLDDAELGALAGLTSAADKIPYFTGLGTAAVADFPAAMRTFLTTPSSANLAALVSDDVFSLSDAELGALAGLTSAADKLPYFTGSGTAAVADFPAAMRTFLTTPSSANLAALVSDDVFSLADAELGALAGLTSAADKIPYFTGSGTAAVADFTTFGRALVDDAAAVNGRSTLGFGRGLQADAPSLASGEMWVCTDKSEILVGMGA